MQIPKRDAATVCYHLWREPHVVEAGPDDVFAAMKVRIADRGRVAHQHAFVGFDRQRQEIDEMLARQRPGGLVDFLDASAGKPQRVDEERSDAAAGIKLQRGEAFGAGSSPTARPDHDG